MTLPIRALVPALALLLAACGTPAPREQFFTLSAPAQGALPTGTSPSVFVGPVAIPEGVDRTQLVLRTGANEVDISDDLRWAEPLRSAIPRVLAESIARDLGTQRVMTARQAAGTAVDYRVAVEVQRFDSSLADGATIDALWTVSGTRGTAPRQGATHAHETLTGSGPAALAAAHGRALARIGHDIAEAIRSIQSQR